MIDLNAMNEWQNRDDLTGLVFPWYTKSFLDELVTWGLRDKVVFEYGAGASTLWWAKKCKQVFGVESNSEYVNAINDHLGGPAIKHETIKDTYIKDVFYCKVQYDIIIIDGEPIQWRDDCVKPALDCLKPGGKLIIDNWDQKSVGWLPSEKTRTIVTALPHIIYSQAGHPDWKTLVATKP